MEERNENAKKNGEQKESKEQLKIARTRAREKITLKWSWKLKVEGKKQGGHKHYWEKMSEKTNQSKVREE